MSAMLSTLYQDLRFAIRQFRQRPGFTATAIVVLALGIGATTAIFSLVNAFLLHPLPYRDPAHLVGLFETDPVGPIGSDIYNEVAPGNFLDWRRDSKSFKQMAATASDAYNLASLQSLFEPERIDATLASQALFSLLGVRPILGRDFRPDEDRLGAQPVAIISYRLWQRRFGGARDVIGKRVRLEGENTEIIGVMPRGFGYPYRTTDVWTPLLAHVSAESQQSHDIHFLLVIARLRPGVSLAEAHSEIDGFAKRYKAQHPEEVSGKGGNAVLLQDYLVRNVRKSLLILLGAVVCVLVIACVNVANLLLVRAANRTREIAVREAIGASQGQIVRQLLTESLLLSFVGAAGGLLLANAIAGFLIAHAPGAEAVLPPGALPLDPMVFLFAFGVAAVAGVCAGLYPAIQSTHSDLARSLKDSSRSATASRAHGRFRDTLVAAEIALSMILLIGAGLLARSFAHVYSVKPGVRLNHTLMVGLSIPDPSGHGNAKTSATIRQLSDRLGQVPGVLSAGMTSCPPVLGHCSDYVFEIEGKTLPPGQMMDALNRGVDPSFFQAAGIPLLKGRSLTLQDGLGFDKAHPRQGSVVISESLARQYFAGEDPIGRFIVIGADREFAARRGVPVPHYQVVGVVGDVLPGIDREVQPTLYTSLLDGEYNNVYVILHTAGEPHSVAGPVRAEVHRLEPEIPLFRVSTMEEALGLSASDRQFQMLLFASFAGLALLLAAVGLYGVLSYNVTLRTGEIGIRLALGADNANVRGLILKQGMRPASMGILVGLLGAFSLVRILASLLFHVAPFDPLTFAAIPVFLLAIAGLACFLPALRATRINPTVALRTE